jgi:hypothetical protein
MLPGRRGDRFATSVQNREAQAVDRWGHEGCGALRRDKGFTHSDISFRHHALAALISRAGLAALVSKLVEELWVGTATQRVELAGPGFARRSQPVLASVYTSYVIGTTIVANVSGRPG